MVRARLLAAVFGALLVVPPFAPSMPAAAAPPNVGSGHVRDRFDTTGDRDVSEPVVAATVGGDIVVAGLSYDGIWDRFVGLARYELPHGTLDSGYATGGRAELSVQASGDVDLTLYDGAVDATGRIVLAGKYNSDFVVIRVDATGGLDSTFDGDGIRVVDLGGADVAYGMTFDGTDIVVTGYRWAGPGTLQDLAIVRLDDSGALDTTFDTDGIVWLAAANSQEGRAVAAVGGDVVVAGTDNSQWTFTRFAADGSLVTTFDGDGSLAIPADGTWLYGAPNEIVVAGTEVIGIGWARVARSGGDQDEDAAFVRVDATGALVSTFDGPGGTGNGRFTLDTGPIPNFESDDRAFAALVDGTELVAGGQWSFWSAYQGWITKLDLATGDYVDAFSQGAAGPGMVSSSGLEPVRALTKTASGYAAAQADAGSTQPYQVSVLDDDDGSFVASFGAPPVVGNVSAVAGNAQATVSWDAPTDTGGAPITGYTIVVRPGDYEVSGGTGTSKVVTGLTNGVEYQFAVKASNGAGTSTESVPSAGITPTAPPPATTTTTTTAPPPPPAPRPRQGVVAPSGPVTVRDGHMVAIPHATPAGVRIVAAAQTASQNGSWTVSPAGAVYAYGDAPFLGSMGGTALNKPVNGMTVTPSGNGYWLVATDGGMFSFGDAQFYGSTGSIKLNKPIVGMAATPSNHGYWLVASDGGIFAFGDAAFFGSTGAITLNKPINGMASTPSGNGYWMVASDGGIFAFGDAQFYGSVGGGGVGSDIVGMISSATGHGYTLITADGRLFPFGDA